MTPALLLTDSYKLVHKFLYPEGITRVYSNYTARGSRLEGVDSITFFGLQYWIKKYLIENWNETFFNRSKDEVMAEYKSFVEAHAPIPDYKHIEALHDLGYLPIEVKAVPEGTEVPIGVPCLTICNTHDDFAWLTNMLESNLSNILWMGINSATIANAFRKVTVEYFDKTSDNDFIKDYVLHEFAYRGMAGTEAAEISGGAFLTSSKGTDNIPAICMLMKYYNSDVCGFSVPASEHSQECSLSVQSDGSIDSRVYIKRMLDVIPKGIVSVVGDGYDYWKMVTEHLLEFKDQIMARDGKLVIRGDSGDPVDILCGHDWPSPNDDVPEHVKKGTVECLWDIFGGVVNSKGYKVLDSHIGTIYGDAITRDRQKEIYRRLEAKGFSVENVILGVGSYSLQYNTRDTHGGAVKATYIEVSGEGKNIFKDPKTGDGSKKSMKGLLKVNPDFTVDQEVSWGEEADSVLTSVFKDGTILVDQSLEDIRKRVRDGS